MTARPTLLTLLPLGLVLLLAGASGCDRSGSHACNLIGCQDQATLSLRRTDGQPPGVAVSLDLDGHQVECAAPPAGADSVCANNVSIASRERVSCTEERTQTAVSLKCVPTGTFEEIITITGTPAVIRVTARLADAAVAERTFEPRYRASHPNGPDCEPTCRQWSDVWDLP